MARSRSRSTPERVAASSASASLGTFMHLWGGVIASIFALDENELWTSEDGGRVRHSTDGGASWSFQTTPDEVRDLLQRVFFRIDTLGRKVGWAVSEDGRVIHSLDGGVTWEQVVQFQDPGVPGANAELWDVFFLSDLQGWVAGQRLLKRTTDGGATWTDVTIVHPLNPTPPENEYYRFAFVGDPIAFVGLVSTEPGRILRTDDGATWTVVYDEAFARALVPPRSAPLEIWSVAFEPGSTVLQASAFAVAGKGNGQGYILKSVTNVAQPCADLADCWTQDRDVVAGPHHAASPAALYDVTALGGGNLVACGYGGNVLLREPGGPWTNITDPAFTTQPLRSDTSAGAQSAWISGLWNEIRRSTDGGASWVNQAGGTTFRLRAIHFVDSQRGFAVGQFLRIATTDDGGKTWRQVVRGSASDPAQKKNLFSITFSANGKAGLAVGDLGWFWASSDGGTTWNGPARFLPEDQLETPLRGVAFAGAMPGGLSAFWVVGDDGVAYRTLDGGTTWEPVPELPADVDWKSVTNDGQGRLFVLGRLAGEPVAWRIDDPTGSVQASDLAWGETFPTASLVSISAFEDQVFAAGSQAGDGLVLRYDVASGSFSDVQTLTSKAFHAVAVAPDPATQTLQAFAGGADGGMLWYDGSGSGWQDVKCQTSENIRGLSFLSAAEGWLVGLREDELGDSVVVGYRAPV